MEYVLFKLAGKLESHFPCSYTLTIMQTFRQGKDDEASVQRSYFVD